MPASWLLSILRRSHGATRLAPRQRRGRGGGAAAGPLQRRSFVTFNIQAGRVAAARERCLARHRAASRADSAFTYDYHTRGGWVEMRGGRRVPEPTIKTLANMAND